MRAEDPLAYNRSDKSLVFRDQLVCVSMVVVVLDAPGLEWVYERHEHHCPNNVFQ